MNPKKRNYRILVADDEDIILESYQRVLSPAKSEEEDVFASLSNLAGSLFQSDKDSVGRGVGKDFELFTCHQGDEAVASVKQAVQEGRPFSVAFLDVRMPPGPDGIWTAEQIRKIDPNIEIVIVTGYSDFSPETIAQKIRPAHKLLYVQKPFHPQELTNFASSLGSKWKSETDLKCAYEKINASNRLLQDQIKEYKAIEAALRKSEERYRTVLESSPDPIATFDMKGRSTYINPAFSKVFGWSLEEFCEQKQKFSPEHKQAETQMIFEKINAGNQLLSFETERLNKNGETVDVSISGAGFSNPSDGLHGCILTFQNITEKKEKEKEINFLAYHDSLTNLPNRKSFYLKLEEELSSYQIASGGDLLREGDLPKGALLFLDLNKFKNINDTLGHDIGDLLLKVIADRIQNCLRKSDWVFRLGGDEFTIILPGVTNGALLVKMAEKILNAVGQPFNIKGYDLHINFSIGITIYPDDAADVETLVKFADMAMYVAKEKGVGYHFYTEAVYKDALKRMKLEADLRRALDDEQFFMLYQPLLDNQGHLVGLEALIRWHNGLSGEVRPDQFIPVAEETGLIIPLGKWIFSNVCRQIAEWEKKGLIGFNVGVNVSPRQFRDPGLTGIIDTVLADTKIAPERLTIEITESGVMDKPEEAILKMDALSRQGIHFAIDDFGTGYSSLSYLKRFPIDVLKIDRSFVADAESSKGDREIIKTIISMARSMNIEVVAEGIETEGQKNLLVEYGCKILQGFYFGAPMSPERIEEEFLKNKETYNDAE